MIEKGIEPIVTISHYELPLQLVRQYGGWANHRMIDLFVRYSKVLLDRYHDQVKYWIVINQINLIHFEAFASLDIFEDKVDNYEQTKFQSIHHQFVASAQVTEYAHRLFPPLQMGMMLADSRTDPKTPSPEDVTLNFKRNRMQYYFSDVLIHGKYPRYVWNFFKDENIALTIEDGEMDLIANNTADFLCISYYYSNVVDSTKDTMNPATVEGNPFVKSNEWGWGVNPQGLYVTMSAYWDRYHIPMMIGENGFGYNDVLTDDHKVHDDYRIAYTKAHLQTVWDAIVDGADIFAFCSWAPFDIVSAGTAEMSKRYGFIYVDYNDFGEGTGKFYEKDSFSFYRRVIDTHGASLD